MEVVSVLPDAESPSSKRIPDMGDPPPSGIKQRRSAPDLPATGGSL